ncbi:MAG: hypothetical protein VKL00_10955 [Synechococcales bacterium]|nr:hypothetical protein [Cyanobacteria bacterium REEB444]MEB3126124.1 hypothetical protein [Synechococcales bacterium]
MNYHRLHSRQQVRQVHIENLRKNFERRLATARTNGDESLIRQLEAEAQYMGWHHP